MYDDKVPVDFVECCAGRKPRGGAGMDKRDKKRELSEVEKVQ